MRDDACQLISTRPIVIVQYGEDVSVIQQIGRIRHPAFDLRAPCECHTELGDKPPQIGLIQKRIIRHASPLPTRRPRQCLTSISSPSPPHLPPYTPYLHKTRRPLYSSSAPAD